MKTLWTLISTLALANLLAILGFLGWLATSDRLSRDRVEEIRVMLSRTVATETAEKTAEEAAAKKAEAEKADAERDAKPPIRAAARIEEKQVAEDIEHQRKLRLDSELKSLQEFLVRENDRLIKWEQELKGRETAFSDEQKKIDATSGTEQFKKALATLNGVKAKEAQSILNELLVTGKTEEVVAYLNAMEERSRSKVLAEFNKVDPRVAADLLERLKTYGIMPSVTEASPDATNKP